MKNETNASILLKIISQYRMEHLSILFNEASVAGIIRLVIGYLYAENDQQ